MDLVAVGLFLTSAIALFGSPGPAIVSLLAVGRAEGLKTGLRYYAGLLLGMALAAGASAFGLLSLFEFIPLAKLVMAAAAAAYLIYLAYRIATMPVGEPKKAGSTPSSPIAGILLGLANPKAYVAFVALYSSHALISGDQNADTLLKWLLCVCVMLVVDMIWLLAGVGLGRVRLSHSLERALNVGLAAMIVGATILAMM